MVKFKKGLTFKKTESNGNTYQVLDMSGCGKIAYVQCLEYYGPENLGDGIELYGYGHTCWIANFFEYLFTEA